MQPELAIGDRPPTSGLLLLDEPKWGIAKKQFETYRSRTKMFKAAGVFQLEKMSATSSDLKLKIINLGKLN
jgi:hypothetical protein